MGALDGQILLWIQSLRTPLLNKFMVFYTQLGDHGLLFITMALLLIAIPATRRTGCASAFGLAIGALVGTIISVALPKIRIAQEAD